MKLLSLKIFTALLALSLCPASLHAWCWIRDTGSTSLGCASSQYKQSCCNGNLRLWTDGTIEYRISDVTPDPLIVSLKAGIDLWNSLEMSSFLFDYQGTSAFTSVSKDETNLINIDPDFATRNNMIGEGILAISTTWTQGSGTSYRAVESDIAFNGEEFNWGDGTGGTINTTAVVAHESGHSAGLSHAGVECQNAGSEGCGANFEEATMYWLYSAGNPGQNNKASLELDDAAALIHGYPVSTFTVKVVNNADIPVPGITVELLDAAAPRDGQDSLEGGRVYGDVTHSDVLMGDKAPSGSYINQTPFDLTNASGLTNAIHPTRRTVRIRASIGGFSQTVAHTLINGPSTLTVTMPDGLDDLVGPLLSITSHTSGDLVKTDTLTLTGTASDLGRGDSGVQQVTVNGLPAEGGSATTGETATWSAEVPLVTGSNTITVSATDNATTQNETSQSLSITYDIVPPAVVRTYPSNGISEIPVNSSISVQFNETMNPDTLSAATFTNNRGLSGQVTYDAASRTATVTPESPLAPLTAYTFTLTPGIQDTAGNALAAPVVWTFTTQAAPASSSSSSGGCFIQVSQE
ncbi:Ig-like domain-containing protein [Desulfoluna sp.]|uniref:Ig-like domain-containing protein n=1 Tax=Desulfoluna sp. TaxID=2045199 RepID=UPI00261592E5|nr:Ig-like domain-containing protein [Desulfoluna sp.]